MPNITYNLGIPAAGNNPSTDQPNMQTNNDANDTIWNVDHYGFNLSNGGYHQQATFTQSGGIPSTAAANLGVLYVKSDGSTSQIYYSPDASGDEYQLTVCTSANYSTFGNSTSYIANHSGGWTFLPGGLILQYGVRSSSGSSGSVTYPRTFPTATYNVQLTPTGSSALSGATSSYSTSGFNYNVSSAVSSFRWIAIGK